MSLSEQDPRTPVAWSVALRGAVRGRAVAQTSAAALAVGSTLFMVNLYAQVREGPLTWTLAVRIALTFLVPWFNATTGIALGLRRPGSASRGGSASDASAPPPSQACGLPAGPVER
ncbi:MULTISPECIES: hypothetical protein [unclassified Streptomyces]|uniref:hypothetical protein n=1 Tax=unclassified Streptomyces TaxID=2593676 RepID=UPI00380B3C28